jgi:hypothetical protein
MNESYPKLIESNHYHLWTDVLHARKLAHQASDRWNRGAYVRWTVIIAWTVLEMACQEALNNKAIAYRFKENLDAALSAQGVAPLDWGQGAWQQVTKLQKIRINYVHRFANEFDLFPDATVANDAVDIVRHAVKDIFSHVGKSAPLWIDDDTDQGWESTGVKDICYTNVIRSGANAGDPDRIDVVYVHNGNEIPYETLASGANYKPVVDSLRQSSGVPTGVKISMIRVYEGGANHI